MDFDKILNDASEHVRGEIRKRHDVETAKQKREAETARRIAEAIDEAHSVSVRFGRECIEPRIEKLQQQIPGSFKYTRDLTEDNFLIHELKCGSVEYISVTTHYGQHGLTVTILAQVAGTHGYAYEKRAPTYSSKDFPDQDAKVWVETHLIEAFKEFGPNSNFMRNPPTGVTYNGKSLS